MEQPTPKPLLDLTDYFAEIERWLADPEAPRFFMLTGEPGIGKTAVTACLTQLYEQARIGLNSCRTFCSRAIGCATAFCKEER